MKLNIVVHKYCRGGYRAEVPSFPGCVVEGRTLEELERKLRDAVETRLLTPERRAQTCLVRACDNWTTGNVVS